MLAFIFADSVILSFLQVPHEPEWLTGGVCSIRVHRVCAYVNTCACLSREETLTESAPPS